MRNPTWAAILLAGWSSAALAAAVAAPASAAPAVPAGAATSAAAPVGAATQPPADVETIVVPGTAGPRRPAQVLGAYETRERALTLYRMRDYERAFPLLEQAAMLGFKDAQAILGEMYLMGIHVPRNSGRGIGWIAVAAEETTMPAIRNYWRAMMRQVPPDKMGDVERVAAGYIAAYGKEAQGMKCQMRNTVGTHFRAFECRLDDDRVLDPSYFGIDSSMFPDP